MSLSISRVRRRGYRLTKKMSRLLLELSRGAKVAAENGLEKANACVAIMEAKLCLFFTEKDVTD